MTFLYHNNDFVSYNFDFLIMTFCKLEESRALMPVGQMRDKTRACWTHQLYVHRRSRIQNPKMHVQKS